MSSGSSSRLGKQVEHKTKQAQKLLQMLKQKRQKKKQAAEHAPPQPQIIISPCRQPSLQDKKLSTSSNNDSFRTCNNMDSYLAELYFKIFSEPMGEPSQAATDLENCLQNMRKQLMKVTDQLAFSKQLMKNQERDRNGVIDKLNKDIVNLLINVKEQRERNQELNELLQKKNQVLNSSAIMNASMIYDGYEQKIKQLAARLQKKQKELMQVWDKNRDVQTQIFQLHKKCNNLQRDAEETDKERETLMELVERLSKQIQSKENEKVNTNAEALSIKQKQFEIVRAKYQKQIQSLHTLLSQKQSVHTSTLLAHQEASNLLQEQLTESQNQAVLLQGELERQQQARSTLESQLKSQIAQLGSLHDDTSDKVGVLEGRKFELEQLLKDSRKENDQLQRDHKTKIKQLEQAKKKELQKLQNSLRDANTEISSLQKQSQHLSKLITSKQTQISQLVNVTQELTEELTHAKQELDQYENRVELMKESNAELMANRENNRKKLEELESNMVKAEKNCKLKQEQLGQLRQKCANLEERINKLQAQNQQLHQSAHKLRVQKQKLIEQSRQLEQKQHKLEQQLHLQQKSSQSPQPQSEQPSKHSPSQQQKTKQNMKYIRTIEQLTQELNQAYRKINEQTRLTKQHNGKDKDKDNRDGSKEKNSRARSVNKLKSYFGFGGKNQQ